VTASVRAWPRERRREETDMLYILMWLLGLPLSLILILFLLGIGR
jgi:hypothetical protein